MIWLWRPNSGKLESALMVVIGRSARMSGKRSPTKCGWFLYRYQPRCFVSTVTRGAETISCWEFVIPEGECLSMLCVIFAITHTHTPLCNCHACCRWQTGGGNIRYSCLLWIWCPGSSSLLLWCDQPWLEPEPRTEIKPMSVCVRNKTNCFC